MRAFSAVCLGPLLILLYADHYLIAMNSQMRRIDLVCKLGAPLCVSILDNVSTQLVGDHHDASDILTDNIVRQS